VRWNIQTDRKQFPTYSRSSISNNNHYLKVTASKLSLVSNLTKGSHGLQPNDHVGYQNPSWHMSIYNGTYPKTACFD